MRVLDLFSGIGGFSLGLERAGMQTVAFCEIEPYCQAVLKKHWPDVPIYSDIRTLTGDTLARDGIAVDVICGGFPCQDISGAGRKSGIDGERSGLWADFARLIGELRPAYAIVENVADLLHRGIGRVLGDMAALGYDAEWHAVPVCAVGGPHERDRCWIIAYPNERERANRRASSVRRRIEGEGEGYGPLADASRIGRGSRRTRRPDSSSARQQEDQFAPAANAPPLLGQAFLREQQDRALRSHWTDGWQELAASLRGVDDGVSCRVDGLAALGNTLCPQIPEMIGRAILAAQKEGRTEARPETMRVKPNRKPHHQLATQRR